MGETAAWVLLVALSVGAAFIVYRRRGPPARGVAVAPRHPYHCVLISAQGEGCDAVRELAGRRFLASEAPSLPLPGCTRAACACIYVHFEDRRHQVRRTSGSAPTAAGERRNLHGRRKTDLLFHPGE